jgi:hypothetical protein
MVKTTNRRIGMLYNNAFQCSEQRKKKNDSNDHIIIKVFSETSMLIFYSLVYMIGHENFKPKQVLADINIMLSYLLKAGISQSGYSDKLGRKTAILFLHYRAQWCSDTKGHSDISWGYMQYKSMS